MAETASAPSYGLRRRQELYGLDRNRNARNIKAKLTHSHVLTSGEYNFDIEKSKEGIWKTSTGIDYRSPHCLEVPENKVEVHGPTKGKGQLAKHFEFGSSQDQPDEIDYHLSRTKQDYDPKGHAKPKVLQENRTVNWPDMAPQLAVNRSTGRSEYDGAYLDKSLPLNMPEFPRVNTSKIVMPCRDEIERFNSKVNVRLGSDPREFHSETQRSFTAPAGSRGNLSLLDMLKQSTDVSDAMIKMTRNSNVFRGGDYNNLKQAPGSTFTVDYGKRLSTPSTVKMLPADDADGEQNKKEAEGTGQEGVVEGEDTHPRMPQLIGKFLKHDLEGVYTEAARGKSDQTKAHFLFGSDDSGARSVYKKDFGKDTRTKPRVTFKLPPENSKVIAFDPALNSTGRTSTASSHVPGTFQLSIPANESQRQRTLVNMARRHGNNVVISYDKEKHAADRQTSLSHESYVQPPSDFKPMEAKKKPPNRYNYIETDVALSFPVTKQKVTEAQNQFRPISMDAESSRERQITSRNSAKSRAEWGLETHFTNGYVPMAFHTENRDLFRGESKDAVDMPVAGKTEKKSEHAFAHHDHSVNTQDTQPEPNSRSQRMGVPLRAFPALPTHKASIMTNDYPPLNNRKFTAAQELMIKQDSKLGNRPVASSHLFHTDNSGSKNFVTTAMSDYIKPEMMAVGTPRTLTSVR